MWKNRLFSVHVRTAGCSRAAYLFSQKSSVVQERTVHCVCLCVLNVAVLKSRRRKWEVGSGCSLWDTGLSDLTDKYSRSCDCVLTRDDVKVLLQDAKGICWSLVKTFKYCSSAHFAFSAYFCNNICVIYRIQAEPLKWASRFLWKQEEHSTINKTLFNRPDML